MIVRMRRLLPGLAVVAAALAVAAPARADVTIEYFTLPAELKGVTNGLEVSPAGTVYFGSGDGFEPTPPIGRLNPALAVAGTSAGITGVEHAGRARLLRVDLPRLLVVDVRQPALLDAQRQPGRHASRATR